MPGTYTNRFIFCADGSRFYTISNHVVTTWNTATWKPVSAPVEFTTTVSLMAKASSAEVMATGAGNDITFFDGATGNRLHTNSFSTKVGMAAISNIGNLAAVATDDDLIHVLDVSARHEILEPISLKSRKIAEWGKNRGLQVFGMVFSPDRRLLAVPMYNGETLVYSLAAPQSPRVYNARLPSRLSCV
jgi:WD40 repeat protein